jgi:hypothetical protein
MIYSNAPLTVKRISSSAILIFGKPLCLANFLSNLTICLRPFDNVFPVVPGSIMNGIPTAHSHPFMNEHFKSEEHFVWRDFESNTRGSSIQPLYKEVSKSVKTDPLLYKLLALIDVIRVGRVREIKVAVGELKRIILNKSRIQCLRHFKR